MSENFMNVYQGLAVKPRSSDPTNPQEGDVQFADGTARQKGLWQYIDADWKFLSANVGPFISDWIDFTPTGTWTTNTTYTGKYRRVGSQIEIQYLATLTGAPNATGLSFYPPSGLTIDSSSLLSQTGALYQDGQGELNDGATVYPTAGRYNISSGEINVVVENAAATISRSSGVTNTSPVAIGSGDAVTLNITLPIQGWSSGIKPNQVLSGKLHFVEAHGNDGETITALTEDIPFKTATIDESSAWSNAGNTGSNTADAFTAPELGYYDIAGYINHSTNVNSHVEVYVNGSVPSPRVILGSGDSVDYNLSGTVYLNAGDVLTFRFNSTMTLSPSAHRITIQKANDTYTSIIPEEATVGVDNTGVTDVTTELAAYLTVNDSLLLGDGTYTIGDLDITGKKVSGTGKIVKAAGAERVFIMGSDSTVEGLTFESTTTGTQRAEIQLKDSAENIRITNCTFKGSIYAAISADVNGSDDSSLTYANPASDVIISDNIFDGYTRPLYLHSVKNIVISDNIFKNCTRDAIRLRQNIGFCTISNNSFKDIGTLPTIVERPKNWSSLESYTSGTQVSVPPTGIYQANKTTTIGENPSTTGSADWDLIDGGYFETKDAIDAFWSGKDLTITGNVIDRTASVGFDIKGSEPSGEYSTRNVIISNNQISRTYGIGINFHSSDLLTVGANAGQFRYVGNCIISNNVISECNAERYDVNQAAINLRQGSTNVTVSDNMIRGHYARGMNILNLEGSGSIQRSISVIGNQIVDCGIPGDAGNVGLNISPVDGLIVKGNIIENTNGVKQYELVATGTVSSTNSLDLTSKLTQSDISVDLTGSTTIKDFLTDLKTEMESKDFPDNPNPGISVKYYDKVTVDGEETASLRYQDLLITSVLEGAAGNAVQFELVHDNVIATSVNVGAVDVVGNTVTVTVRTSARTENVVNVFNSYKVAAGADTLMTIVAYPGTSTGIFEQPVSVPTAPVNLTGGADADRVSFSSRIDDTFANETFPVTIDGLSVDLVENKHYTNSVNRTGIVIRDDEVVGSSTFSFGIGKVIISENIIRNNAAQPRYEILYNGQELTTPLAYVTSNNAENNTIVAPSARQAFTGGANSDATTHLNTFATVTDQEITLQARQAGAIGGYYNYEVSQSTNPNQILSVLVAPITTVNGYQLGGFDIKVILPADGGGSPVDATIAEVEAALKTKLNQAILKADNNILS